MMPAIEIIVENHYASRSHTRHYAPMKSKGLKISHVTFKLAGIIFFEEEEGGDEWEEG